MNYSLQQQTAGHSPGLQLCSEVCPCSGIRRDRTTAQRTGWLKEQEKWGNYL